MLYQIKQVLPIPAFEQGLGDGSELIFVDKFLSVSYFFYTRDFDSLTLFNYMYKLGCLH